MNLTDISDLARTSGTGNGGAQGLPIRGEKQFLAQISGDESPTPYFVHAALTPFQQFLRIRLAGRGGAATGNPDPTTSAVYNFLINPKEVSIARQTVDAQSFSRGGWKIGLWGEDFISINLSGKTPGRYFANGLTDYAAPLTESYRNLAALERVVENNGYWFEGEQAMLSNLNSKPRHIKMHQDVELLCGEFLWFGMFEGMEMSEDADSPFLANFTLNFTAWKECFVNGTPYPNSISGETQRGHVPKQTTSAASIPTAPTASYLLPTSLTDYVTDPSKADWTE